MKKPPPRVLPADGAGPPGSAGTAGPDRRPSGPTLPHPGRQRSPDEAHDWRGAPTRVENDVRILDEPGDGDAGNGRADWRWLILVVVLAVALVVAPHGHAPATDRPSGARSVAPTPPGELPKVGSYVESRIRRDGRIAVTQWVRTRKPLRAVDLALPRVRPQGRPVRAVRVRIIADGSVVAGPRFVGRAGRHVVLDNPSTTIRVRYTLRGLVDRSTSAGGRAIARATALRVRHGAGRRGPTRIDVVAAKMLSVTCLSAPEAQPRPCGAPRRGRWHVVLRGPRRDDVVQAQVDLR